MQLCFLKEGYRYLYMLVPLEYIARCIKHEEICRMNYSCMYTKCVMIFLFLQCGAGIRE